MRSFLFVPPIPSASSPKAPVSGPDGLILDLEDSVATDRKTIAPRHGAWPIVRSANRAGPKLFIPRSTPSTPA
jgi:citrate lyase subunit beta/citryl-CoA lyase